ncbi:MAG TPA: thioredoxin [Gemmatimonadaceae bacterium]|nr:thioredoxin [Gemmatimonadaceae bacterium]
MDVTDQTEKPVTEAETARKATLRCQFCTSWNRVDVTRASDRPKCGSCGKPMLLDRPIKLDDESFARTIADSEVPVIVDFYADWCGPCKMMAPAVDQLAANYAGRALVAKLDTDAAQRTSMQFQIRGIPTSIVFKDGREVTRKSGAVPYQTLAGMLEQGETRSE